MAPSQTTGACLCGKVSFTLNEPPSSASACHCAMCRTWSSGPFLAAHVEQAPVIEGQENLTWYESSDWAERGFCSNCGANLFYRLKGDPPQYVISVGALKDTQALSLTEQIFIDEKPAYYAFAGDIPALTGAEVFAKYAPDDQDN
jgi:hypothetical protein